MVMRKTVKKASTMQTEINGTFHLMKNSSLSFRKLTNGTAFSCILWWKTRGVVENTGSQWKTRALSAKHGGTIISPNNEVEILLFQIAMKINRRETRFLAN